MFAFSRNFENDEIGIEDSRILSITSLFNNKNWDLKLI